MLVKGSCGRPELILAFREDGKNLTGYKRLVDHKAVLGTTVSTLAFLDSLSTTNTTFVITAYQDSL